MKKTILNIIFNKTEEKDSKMSLDIAAEVHFLL